MRRRRYEHIGPERCSRCHLLVRPRRHKVIEALSMLVCPCCNAFLRYVTKGGDET